ncbi:MAG: hypothetical protein GX633_01690 [Clostridiales bacterium]|nr:hypothetical protein [Clostridiales bacterium]
MGKLKIGWAERDITYRKMINLPGHLAYHFPRDGVHDPLTTTALVLENGEDIAIFLSVDGMALRAFALDEIRAKVLEKNPEIDVWKIIANTTHAHTGPSYDHEIPGKLNIERLCKLGYSEETIRAVAEYEEGASLFNYVDNGDIEIGDGDDSREYFTDLASDAICEAYANRKYGGFSYGYGYAVVGHSRRAVYFDDLSKRPGVERNARTAVHGHAMMYGDTTDPQFSHYEAGADHFVNILFTFDENDKLNGAVINVPCPSQCSEGMNMLTADYWCDVKRELRAKYGNIPILPQCAAAGDLSPHMMHYKKAFDRRLNLKFGEETDPQQNEIQNRELKNRRDIAERICWAFDEVLSWAKKDIRRDITLKHETKLLQLDPRLITDEEYKLAVDMLADYEQREQTATSDDPYFRLVELSNYPASIIRLKHVIHRYNNQSPDKKVAAEVHAVRVDDMAFATNTFELYMDFMHRIQARSPFGQTFVVQLCGMTLRGGETYICTQRAFENKGYSTSMYDNLASVKGGQDLVEGTLEMLNKIHEN